MDKNKMPPPSTSIRMKRSSTMLTASTSRKVVPNKDKNTKDIKPKINKSTIVGDGDTTTCKTDSSLPDFDAEYRQVTYGKFLRAMLEDCLVEDKIEREETLIDVQMAQLADRFQRSMEQLDKTNRRLKDISFVVEERRLLELRNQDSQNFYDIIDKSNVDNVLDDLKTREECFLDRLETKNVDFGFNNQSGHSQLLDAVNEAIEGLEQIKKHSNLDVDKFKEYEKSNKNLDQLEKDQFELESLKAEFETKFPKFSEKLLKDISEKVSAMMDDDAKDDKDSD